MNTIVSHTDFVSLLVNSRYYGPQSGDIHWSDELPNLSSTANHGTVGFHSWITSLHWILPFDLLILPTAQSSRRIQSEIHISRTVEAHACDFEEHLSTRSRATETSLKTHVINMMDVHSVRDFEAKVDLGLNPDGHDGSPNPRVDVRMNTVAKANRVAPQSTL